MDDKMPKLNAKTINLLRETIEVERAMGPSALATALELLLGWYEAAQKRAMSGQVPGMEAMRLARQDKIGRWIVECFGEAAMEPAERGARLLEEAAELAQATALNQAAAERILAKVFARPIGNPRQEIGGVATTLLGCCAALGIHLEAAEMAEIERIHTPEIMAKAKRRHAENIADGTSALQAAERGKA